MAFALLCLEESSLWGRNYITFRSEHYWPVVQHVDSLMELMIEERVKMWYPVCKVVHPVSFPSQASDAAGKKHF